MSNQNLSVKVKPNDVEVKFPDKVEVSESFKIEPDKIMRLTYHDEVVTYVLCRINDVPCVLMDARDEFVEFLSNFTKD